VSDQWLEPYVIVGEDDKPVGAIEDGDSVLIFNFRAGTALELSPDIENQHNFTTMSATAAIVFCGSLEWFLDTRPHPMAVCAAVQTG
jgi:2,3-bisphosphoglycerate-independent phosphoglycerate mutase